MSRDPAGEAVEAALRDADAAGMPVVDEDRRASPSAKWTFVERPPMSQRSHIAHSGSSGDQRVLGGVQGAEERRHLVEPLEQSRRRGRTRRPRSRRSTAGRRSGITSIVEPSAIALRWYAITCSVTETRPRWSSTPAIPAVRSVSSIAVSLSFCTCVYQSTPTGSTTATRPLRIEAAHEVLLAEMEVDGALVHGRDRRAPARRARGRSPVVLVDDRERVGVTGAEREPRRRDGRVPSRRSPRASARARRGVAARSSASGPSVVASSSTSGPS